MHMIRERTQFKIIVYVVATVLAIGLLSWWLWLTHGWQRDALRLQAILSTQAELARYYDRHHTFQFSTCPSGSLLATCATPELAVDYTDPLNTGNYRYTVQMLGETEYAIGVSFEHGIAGMRRGSYVLTTQGLKPVTP